MKMKTILGLLILVVGILITVYGTFTYTKKTHKANLGAVTLAVSEKEKIHIPLWAGVAAIVVGGVIVVFPIKKA